MDVPLLDWQERWFAQDAYAYEMGLLLRLTGYREEERRLENLLLEAEAAWEVSRSTAKAAGACSPDMKSKASQECKLNEETVYRLREQVRQVRQRISVSEDIHAHLTRALEGRLARTPPGTPRLPPGTLE